MHIKTANDKKKIVISRREWETIGKKAGWTKTAANADYYFNEECLPPDVADELVRLGREEQEKRGMPLPLFEVQNILNGINASRGELDSDGEVRQCRKVKLVGHLKHMGVKVFKGKKWMFVDFEDKDPENIELNTRM